MKHTLVLFIVCLAAMSTAVGKTNAKKPPKPTIPWKNCGSTGDAIDPATKALNPHKNRIDSPKATDIDKKITLAAMLKPGGDSTRFTKSVAAEITGFVYDVKVGGVETCNCHYADTVHQDTHIELVPTESDTSSKKKVIVEITPRMRKALGKMVDWSTPTLQKTILHKWIKVKGWVLYDSEHALESWNIDPTNKLGRKNWRATVWEVHPITSLEVVTHP